MRPPFARNPRPLSSPTLAAQVYHDLTDEIPRLTHNQTLAAPRSALRALRVRQYQPTQGVLPQGWPHRQHRHAGRLDHRRHRTRPRLRRDDALRRRVHVQHERRDVVPARHQDVTQPAGGVHQRRRRVDPLRDVAR